MKNRVLIAVLALCAGSCVSNGNEIKKETSTKIIADTLAANPEKMADAATILARKEVPVLCYHHIKPIPAGASQTIKDYTVTPAAFTEQLKALKDSGYESILPDQLHAYLAYGKPLPPKPVMFTFDDTDLEQYTIGAAELKKYGFKGVFFIMTISINRPRYMSTEQIKALSDEGHVIACHTWDHHRVTQYLAADWEKQLTEPAEKLKQITGKNITYFAYPFGLWNEAAIPEIKNRGYQLAFILSTKRDSTNPLYTVRRMIVPGTWSTKGVMNAMQQTFHLR